jgi:hypothetical protein
MSHGLTTSIDPQNTHTFKNPKGIPMLLTRASLVIPFMLVCTIGCERDPPSVATPTSIPSEYQTYLQQGKFVPTGNATLDYWVHINFYLAGLNGGPQNQLALPSVLNMLAQSFRDRPVNGVDPDVVAWGKGVAGVLATRADILTQLNDPATMRRAREQKAAGQATVLDDLDRTSADWEQARNKLIAEGKVLPTTLAQRHARPFPSAQLK